MGLLKPEYKNSEGQQYQFYKSSGSVKSVPKLNLVKNLKRLETSENGLYSLGSNSHSVLQDSNHINLGERD